MPQSRFWTANLWQSNVPVLETAMAGTILQAGWDVRILRLTNVFVVLIWLRRLPHT